jgi:hypothetical protein
MFVQDFQIVDHPYDEVVWGFSRRVEQVLIGAIRTMRCESRRLEKVSPAGWPPAVSEAVELRTGLVRTLGDCRIVSLSWETDRGCFLRSLDADLEIAPFGSEQSLMVVRGQYQLPEGVPSLREDVQVLQRLAEATMRAFLKGVCSNIDRCLVGG